MNMSMTQIDTPILPPGPRWTLPVLRLWQLRQDPLGFLSSLARTYGDIAHFNIGPRHYYLLSHPDFVRQVLVDDAGAVHDGKAMQRLKALLGEGLPTNEGPVHAQMRQGMLPAFQQPALAEYLGKMNRQVTLHTADWQDGDVIDVAKAMNQLTLRIIGATLLAYDLSAELETLGSALETLTAFTDPLKMAASGWLLRLPTPQRRRARSATAALNRVIDDVLAVHRGGRALHPNGVVTHLLAMRNKDSAPLAEQTIRDHLVTLLRDAYETTATALARTWHLLAQHPEVEARLSAEVDALLGEVGEVNSETLPRLSYTRLVIKEALRLYPPTWIIERQTQRPLLVGGYEIPAGSDILMSQWTMHRDPRYYDDPGAFRPERWQTARGKRAPAFAYFPFGGGPSSCIGEQLAWTAGTLILAHIARHWRATNLREAATAGVVTGVIPRIAPRPVDPV
ncbi:MAG: cytochrome P450, partial [Caldilineaceae bacterium]